MKTIAGVTLNEEQVETLKDFAKKHGRCWRRALWDLWAQGTDEGVLRQIRNIGGPGWLLEVTKDDLE
jgi:hypothetical protein